MKVWMCALSLLSAAASAGARAPAESEASDTLPNFVWLISEDNSVHYLDLFFAGGAPTPQIARLAEDGLLFTHAFSNAPVCSVARTTLITGCHAPRIGTHNHRKQIPVPLPEGLRMFPALLRANGYYTTNRQKKDYNAKEGGGVWDRSARDATWRGRGDGQPFFHMQSFPVTHESSLHFSTETMATEPTETDPAAVPVAPYHPDTPTFRYTVARYHDRIRAMDRQVGAVVDQLAEDGLLESTFVFYFADHGGVLPGSKAHACDAGLHVPLIVRIPERFRERAGAEIGSRTEHAVSFVDFAPTVLALAGIPVPEPMDGAPFLGPHTDEDAGPILGYADRFDEKYDLVRTLRMGDLLYVRNYLPFVPDALQNNYRYRMLAYQEWRAAHRAGTLSAAQRAFFEPRPAEQLFDLATDPHQVHDLAADPEARVDLRPFREQLGEIVRSWPDLGFLPESVFLADAATEPSVFGARHRERIAQLIDIADLALEPFAEARPRLLAALESDDPCARGWALAVCTSHGVADPALVNAADELARDDPDALVRGRAVEFLAWIGAEPAPQLLVAALESAPTPTDLGILLQTVVLLRDHGPRIDLALKPSLFSPTARENDIVRRRLDYLGLLEATDR